MELTVTSMRSPLVSKGRNARSNRNRSHILGLDLAFFKSDAETTQHILDTANGKHAAIAITGSIQADDNAIADEISSLGAP